jgi:uncharacterized protein (TIGR03086 family)
MNPPARRRLIDMTSMLDLHPAAQQLAALVRAVPDAALGRPTPCPDYSVGDLIDHVNGLSLAFTAAAVKDIEMSGTEGPSADAAQLGRDWRTRIPAQLACLADAWRDPAAWTGMTQAGGVDLPGGVAGLVALDELVVHGWDLARATGQPYACDEASLDAVHAFVAQFSEPGQEAARQGLFGPVVDVPDDAPHLDRVIGLTGRDPGWRPPEPPRR